VLVAVAIAAALTRLMAGCIAMPASRLDALASGMFWALPALGLYAVSTVALRIVPPSTLRVRWATFGKAKRASGIGGPSAARG
jgi:hypothetical protein